MPHGPPIKSHEALVAERSMKTWKAIAQYAHLLTPQEMDFYRAAGQEFRDKGRFGSSRTVDRARDLLAKLRSRSDDRERSKQEATRLTPQSREIVPR